MGPSDLIPQEMSDYFGIPVYAIVLLVFIFGFITVRATQKFGKLKELKSLDEVFLIVVIGLAWFFRIFWVYSILKPLQAFVLNPEFFISYWIVPLAALASIVVIIMVSIHDLEIILNRDIRRRTKIRNFSYLLFKKGEKYLPVDKVNKNIRNSNFILVGYAIMFAVMNIIETGKIGSVQIIAGFLIVFAFSPIIMVTIYLYNYLISETRIIVDD